MCKRLQSTQDKPKGIEHQRLYGMARPFWNERSSKTKRILTVLILFLFSLAVMVISVSIPMSTEEINSKSRDLGQLQANVKNMSLLERTRFIFSNNMLLCLIMFVPVAGPVFGVFVLYNTGAIIAAQSLANHVPPTLYLFLLFLFPFTWLEFIAYSTAFSESYWFVRRLFQHRGLRELKNLGILMIISAALLALGALIEASLI